MDRVPPTGERVCYRAGYKYQLAAPFAIATGFVRESAIDIDVLCLDADGMLTIDAGYAWDGPSGPTFDTPNFIRGSLVHDALYQIMRAGHLDPDMYRLPADKLLRKLCREDGMSAARAWYVYWGLRLGGSRAAMAAGERPVLVAPR